MVKYGIEIDRVYNRHFVLCLTVKPLSTLHVYQSINQPIYQLINKLILHQVPGGFPLTVRAGGALCSGIRRPLRTPTFSPWSLGSSPPSGGRSSRSKVGCLFNSIFCPTSKIFHSFGDITITFYAQRP